MNAILRHREARIAALAVAGIALHLILRSPIPLYITLIAGLPLLFELARNVAKGEFGSDLLAGISILTAVLVGQYLVGAIIVLMLSGGSALEEYATRRASSVLDALAKRTPSTAHRKTEAGLADVALADVAIGDVVVVLPYEICPVDGVVVEGHGSMDEAYLTGEPYEMSKAPGSRVLSGAINQESVLTVAAEKLAVDSRYARIVQVMETAERSRPKIRRIADRLGAWYTPLAVGVAGLAWLASANPQRFLAVLVIATPCPLLIAIPVCVIGAISQAAKRGIIIKNPSVLEQIPRCRTLILDKTGTLTYGKPSLTDVVSAPGFSKDEVVKAAASLEQYSKHPLSSAVVGAATQAGLALDTVTSMSETPGSGLNGIVGDRPVLITGRKQAEAMGVALPEAEVGLECVVFLDERFAGLLRFEDTPREDSRTTVEHLHIGHNLHRVMLVSGDRHAEVGSLAKQVGISEVYAGKSPEEKLEIVREATREAPTLFIGDGINDAPALQAATVGVAFGQNSDIAAEAAGAVILTPSLGEINELIHIGSRMRTIALQSAVGGIALSLLGMTAAATGLMSPLQGAIAQEVIDLLAVLNALRVALPPGWE